MAQRQAVLDRSSTHGIDMPFRQENVWVWYFLAHDNPASSAQALASANDRVVASGYIALPRMRGMHRFFIW
jgi:small-conductance mechanosensitive channel